MKCPICKGSGKIIDPYRVTMSWKRRRMEMAVVLRKAGFSLHEIKRMCGYKSASGVVKSIRNHLK